MKRTDVIGVVAAFTMGAFIVITASMMVMAWDAREQRERVIEQCLAGIPEYVDALEIRYQEQECRSR